MTMIIMTTRKLEIKWQKNANKVKNNTKKTLQKKQSGTLNPSGPTQTAN